MKTTIRKRRKDNVIQRYHVGETPKMIPKTESALRDINYKGYLLKLEVTSNSYPYKILIFNPEGTQIGKTLLLKDEEMVKKEQENIIKELDKKVISKDDFYGNAKRKLEAKGFKVEIKPKTSDWFDPKVIVEKNNLVIPILETNMLDDSYEALYEHFNTIEDVYFDIKNNCGKYVFYSSISADVKRKMPYAKQSYRGFVFSAICDLLEKSGVVVES